LNKIFATLTLALAMIGSVFAQTPYSTSSFSATFNGTVDVDSHRSSGGTSNNVEYSSFANGITEIVIVRTVDHDIDVNLTSSQFYRNNVGGGATLLDKYNSDGAYQGHPFSYGLFTYTKDGVDYSLRSRFIIVNSRTAIFIQMVMPTEKANAEPKTPNDALVVWQDFENSLNIN
jgi:hypothetical protein